MYARKNQLLKRDEILKAVWNTDDFFSGRSMDVFISRLRKYFKEDTTIKIESIRGVGLEFKIVSLRRINKVTYKNNRISITQNYRNSHFID